MGALYPLGPLVYAVSELHYAGADPSSLRFNRTGCFDPVEALLALDVGEGQPTRPRPGM